MAQTLVHVFIVVIFVLTQEIDSYENSTLSFQEYPDLATINEFIKETVLRYPNIVSAESIGKGHEGRDIHLVKIGDLDSDKNAVWIDAGIHAREWISPITALFIIDKLVNEFLNYPENKSPYSRVNWLIIPVANPDGYEFSHTTDRYWRKNRAPPPKTSNCSGVDLNRNFLAAAPHGERGFGVGASNIPCLDFYKGEGPESEPETKAIINAFRRNLPKITTALSIHSYGQYFSTPWGYTHKASPHKKRLDNWASKVVRAIHSVHGTSFAHKTISKGLPRLGGTTKDFYHAEGVVFVATIELRDEGRYRFYLPEDQIIPVGEETWAGMREVAITAASPNEF